MTDQDKISKFIGEIGRVFGPIKQETTKMAFEQKENSGALFKNDRKENEKHPDYNGSLNVAGTDYWLNAWIKTSQKGTKFMSLSLKAKNDVGPKPDLDSVPF